MIRTHYAHMDRGVPEVRIRTIGIRDLQIALRQGWEDFMDRRGDLVFVGFIYPIVGFLAVAIALNWTLLPIFFPLVAGLTLLGPAVASGFSEMARRRERAEERCVGKGCVMTGRVRLSPGNSKKKSEDENRA